MNPTFPEDEGWRQLSEKDVARLKRLAQVSFACRTAANNLAELRDGFESDHVNSLISSLNTLASKAETEYHTILVGGE